MKSCSVSGPQNGFHLGVLEHELSQLVIMTCAHPGEPPVAERQMTVGVQTCSDPQRVRRQVTLEHVVAGDVIDLVNYGKTDSSRCVQFGVRLGEEDHAIYRSA